MLINRFLLSHFRWRVERVGKKKMRLELKEGREKLESVKVGIRNIGFYDGENCDANLATHLLELTNEVIFIF